MMEYPPPPTNPANAQAHPAAGAQDSSARPAPLPPASLPVTITWAVTSMVGCIASYIVISHMIGKKTSTPVDLQIVVMLSMGLIVWGVLLLARLGNGPNSTSIVASIVLGTVIVNMAGGCLALRELDCFSEYPNSLFVWSTYCAWVVGIAYIWYGNSSFTSPIERFLVRREREATQVTGAGRDGAQAPLSGHGESSSSSYLMAPIDDFPSPVFQETKSLLPEYMV